MGFITAAKRARASDERAWGLAALIALGFGCLRIASPFDGNTDVSWLIFICEKLLDGGRLYVDVIELNPPMSVFLYVPPVWLARQTGLAAELSIQAWVIGWAAVSLVAVWHLRVPAGLHPGPQSYVYVAAVTYVLLVMPAHTFGEREHFALFGLLPYLMLSAARWNPVWRPRTTATLAIGLLTGLAVCIKPHFALMVIAPSMMLSMHVRRVTSLFSLENVMAGTIAAAYLAIVLVVYPEFFGDVMTLNRLAYLPSTLSWQELIAAPATTVALLLAALGVAIRGSFTTPLSRVLMVAAGAGFCVYLIQAKGWPYHQLPTLGLGFAAIAAALATRIIPRDTSRFSDLKSIGTRDAALVLAAVSMLGIAAPWMFGEHTNSKALEAEIRKLSDAPTLIIASSNVGLHFPLTRRTNASWVGRVGSLWVTEGAGRVLSRSDDPKLREKLTALIRADRDMFIADAMAARPDIVGFAYLGPDRTFLQWADDVPAFGHFLEGYRRVGVADEILLMVRRDLPVRQPR